MWQLHLSHLSQRDRTIGVAVIEAIDDDGYLRETIEAIAESLAPKSTRRANEILTVLRQVQRFDPPGVGARSLNECLQLQLAMLPDETPGRELAKKMADGPLERLPRIGLAGLATNCIVRSSTSKRPCTSCARSNRAPARRWAACRPIPMSRPMRGVAAARAMARRDERGRATADRDRHRLTNT